MYKILDICFGDRTKINFKEFQKINEEIASDMLLSVLNLFRERLPCSENFWRYKRNYELHMQNADKNGSDPAKGDSNHLSSPGSSSSGINLTDNVVVKKVLASPQMTKVRPLSPYMEQRKVGPGVGNSALLKYAANKKNPSEFVKG